MEHQRSTFVTALAWVFIVNAGLTTLIAILQNIMIFAFFPMERMNEALQAAPVGQIPKGAKFLFTHVEWFFFGFLVVSAITLVSAIGLLKRKDWARILFIVVLSLGIAWSLFSLTMIASGFPLSLAPAEHQPPPEFLVMFNVVRVFTSVMALGFCILLGWIIKKLVSPPIRREFAKGFSNADPQDGFL